MKNVCVMGLGYIGLPTASVLASNGFQVLGVDVSPRVVDTVNSGNIHIEEPGLRTVVAAAIGSGHLRAALKPEKSDVFIIAVPTPLTKDKRADMSYVVQATEQIVPFLSPGCLVILESTSPPGTCRDLLKPILEKSGLNVGSDIYLAHCPERVLPGRILTELIQNDRVIGGIEPISAQRAKDVYATFVEGEIFLTDATTAEMVKIIENTFRDVNIAFANETALLCEKLGINFAEVARLANRHPRVNIHRAGPGVGGHCISVDPWFLVEKFPDDAKIIHLARQRNDAMPHHVTNTLNDMLEGIQDPKVAILGVAFKGNVDDIRESPALEIIHQLNQQGVRVAAHDPYVKHAPIELVTLDACFADADCVVLVTDHSDYLYLNPQQVGRTMRRRNLFDTRAFLPHDQWRNAGFRVRVLGAGEPR
ncbi:MAG TPA: nucleotide sugar dehydrogenase [Candidatus Hydrogenedentes bacterium]|nr:nucleotide sugar dehydrogenase [Candidatus Hydrogenedentota bacterium]HOL78170.1 nucleotide sugar dehydrogenase [Candidatus Hydrogenedentota bacterium]HPO86672.1 nucleotide sugar dehydrogenase [Candidatus Hydrogenedentota bacterium]